jgi:hypothetical protein
LHETEQLVPKRRLAAREITAISAPKPALAGRFTASAISLRNGAKKQTRFVDRTGGFSMCVALCAAQLQGKAG